MGQQQRIQTPDLLKGMAVILMIQVHIMELFALQDISDGPVGMISLFLGGVPAAPVFMIVMGYFLRYREKDPTGIIIRGLKLFVAGMLLNIGMNAHLIYKVFFDGWGAIVNIWPYVFGVDILHLAGLSLIVMGLVIRLFKKPLIPFLMLLGCILLIISIKDPWSGNDNFQDYLLAYVYSHAGWSYFPLLPWLAYPLAGYLFFALEKKIPENFLSGPYTTGIILAGLVFLAFTYRYAAGVTHNLEEYYHHDTLFFLWALLFITWWSATAKATEKILGKTAVLKYIKWLGAWVTPVYVFQWLLIGNIATAVYKTVPLYPAIIWFGVILIFTSLFTFIWGRIKKRYALNFLSL